MPFSDKAREKRWRDDYRRKNPEKTIERVRIWALNNPEKVKKNSRKSRLKIYYNITLEDFDKMMLDQNGLCAICSIPFGETHLTQKVVDHCHETNKVRGILCFSCNAALGYFKDKISSLEKAKEYLCK